MGEYRGRIVESNLMMYNSHFVTFCSRYVNFITTSYNALKRI
jgi:hypothetical protein